MGLKLLEAISYFLLILLVLPFYGCGGSAAVTGKNAPLYSYPKKADTINQRTLPEIDMKAYEENRVRDTKADTMNQRLLEAMMKRPATEKDYVIGPEDLLEIDVSQVEELKKTVRVSAQGNINLPLIGTIKAKGLTAVELEGEIARRLGEKYLEDPLVTVYIKEYRAQRISVLGAVGRPQVYTVSGQRHLLDLIAMADGVTKEAGDICYVIRPDISSGRAETIVITLNSLLVEGQAHLNIPVFSGDIISIPKAGVVFMDGAVERPGVFQLQGKTTLVQALAMAGGVKFEADRSDVRIFRDSGNGEREVIKIDYDNVREGRSPDIVLHSNDIVIVPKSDIKNFYGGFINTIKGLISFGFGRSL